MFHCGEVFVTSWLCVPDISLFILLFLRVSSTTLWCWSRHLQPSNQTAAVPAAADFERRAIQAAALGQQATGCPVNFHPGRDPAAPAEVLRIFQEAGGDVSSCVMSHMDSEWPVSPTEGFLLSYLVSIRLTYYITGPKPSHRRHERSSPTSDATQEVSRLLRAWLSSPSWAATSSLTCSASRPATTC